MFFLEEETFVLHMYSNAESELSETTTKLTKPKILFRTPNMTETQKSTKNLSCDSYVLPADVETKADTEDCIETLVVRRAF